MQETSKDFFQFVRRNAHDSKYCLFYRYRLPVRKNTCELNDNLVNDEKWAITELNRIALDQNQKESRGIDLTFVGVRSYPYISSMPISRCLPPALHTLLGIDNDLHSKFRYFTQEQIERLSDNEVASAKMTFLAEINYEKGLLIMII